MENQLVKASEFGLDEEKAKTITSGLNQILEEREVLASQYSEVIEMEISEENIPTFKDLRLKIRDNRTKGIEAWHKVNKEFYLRGGQFVDAIKRKEVEVNQRMEANLQENETHFERLEAERIAKIQTDRANQLLAFEVENIPSDLGSMQDDIFEAYLLNSKTKFDAKKEAEAKAEQERIEQEKKEAAEREAQRLENIRLKAEAEKREEEIRAERVKQAKKEASEREEAEKQEAKLRAEREAERKKYEAELKAEKDRQAKLEAELQAERDRKAKELEEAEKAKQAELSKGDAAKVKDLIQDLENIKSKYQFKSAKNIKMYEQTCTLIDKVINHIQ